MSDSQGLMTYVAARMLMLNGVEYRPGEPVDLSGVSIRRVQQLHETRKIAPITAMTRQDMIAARKAKAVVPRAQEAAPAPPAAPVLIEVPKAPTGRVRTAVHKGFGRYDVFEGDKQIGAAVPRADLAGLGVETGV